MEIKSAVKVHCERNGLTYTVQDDDIDSFKSHLVVFYEVMNLGYIDQKEYEQLCIRYGVNIHPQSSMDQYEYQYGDFTMSHYLTDPENRKKGIEMLLAQKRAASLEKITVKVEEEHSMNSEKSRVQLWETCQRCDSEPSYLSNNGILCDKCQ